MSLDRKGEREFEGGSPRSSSPLREGGVGGGSFKTLAFSKKLKSVTVEETGRVPIGGKTLEAELAAKYQEGYQAASEKFNAQLLAMRQEMQEHAHGVLTNLENSYAQLAKSLVTELPGLICSGVYKIVGENGIPAEALKSRIESVVAESCPENEPVEVQMNAADLDALKSIDETFAMKHPKLTFLINEKLEKGDCVMQTKFGQVDARLKTQFARLVEELATT